MFFALITQLSAVLSSVGGLISFFIDEITC